MFTLPAYVNLGADPELFIATGTRVIGAEKVIPETGLTGWEGIEKPIYRATPPIVVLDGVQVELHPAPSTCRASLGANVAGCFKALSNFLTSKGVPERPSFVPVVEVDKEEFDTLSDKSKALGCMPSLNVYGREGIRVDPSTYRWRSAGGHIHLGFTYILDTAGVNKDYYFPKWRTKRLEDLVVLLDILLGNTCVLLDRDPLAAQRRLTYGMAGEHRKPEYGLEYRALSNFWLRSYPLMSLVTGLARQAVKVWYADKSPDLISLVDVLQVEKAINLNDFSLAQENFNRIKGYLRDNFPHNTYKDHADPFGGDDMIPKFDAVVKRGIQEVFPQDPLTHWINFSDGHRSGWEAFIANKVRL